MCYFNVGFFYLLICHTLFLICCDPALLSPLPEGKMSLLGTERLDKGDDKERGTEGETEGERQFLFVGINN